MSGEEIMLKAFTIESCTIEADPAEHAGIKAAGELDHEYDTQLSDMDGETFMVESDGEILWPYRAEGSPGNVMDLLAPVLDCVPAGLIAAYVSARFAALARDAWKVDE